MVVAIRSWTMAILTLAMSVATSVCALSDEPMPWGSWRTWGDQGNGIYHNPVLPADFSDIDAIRVGSDYFAISSTLHLSPGMVVLHSKDLVSWRIIGHVVEDLTQIGPEYRWDRLARFKRGVWAGSIRHHAGRFWVFFGTPDEGFFMSSAQNPEGPWEPLHPLLQESGWDDCSVLWDEDGRAYFIGTRFADGYKSYVFRMSADGRSIDRSSAVLVNEGAGREASKLLKVGDWYYIIYSEHFADTGRYVMARRSRHPLGPYNEVRQLAHPSREAFEPNQGGIVQATNGSWYFFTHHGRQSWEGRAASLLPVTWLDGWPIIGKVLPDGKGTMTWHGRTPVANTSIVYPQTSDDFSTSALGPQWEWNHQPRAERWSLTERAGWLRLRAWQPLQAGNPLTAGNLVSQRTFRTHANRVVVKIDTSGLEHGQRAGLGHFSDTYGGLVVERQGEQRFIAYMATERTLIGPELKQSELWLQSTWSLDGKVSFAYSLDGRDFTTFGSSYQQTHANYRGARVGLLNYNDKADRGFVDVDFFHYEFAPGYPQARTAPDRR